MLGRWLSGRRRADVVIATRMYGASGERKNTRQVIIESVERSLRRLGTANETNGATLDVLHAVADDLGRTPAQVALRWLIQQSTVTAPIIGPRTYGRLQDNLGATGWVLGEDAMRRLTEASDRPLLYPQRVLRDYRRGPRAAVLPAAG